MYQILVRLVYFKIVSWYFFKPVLGPIPLNQSAMIEKYYIKKMISAQNSQNVSQIKKTKISKFLFSAENHFENVQN